MGKWRGIEVKKKNLANIFPKYILVRSYLFVFVLFWIILLVFVRASFQLFAHPWFKL